MALTIGSSTKKENGIAGAEKSCGEFTNKAFSSLRPLERKITNIMVPENPLKSQTAPPPNPKGTIMASIKSKISSAVSIILNPPFIQFSPRPSSAAATKKDHSQIMEDNMTSSDEEDEVALNLKSIASDVDQVKSGVRLRTKRKQTSYFQVHNEEKESKPNRSRDRSKKPRRVKGKGSRSKPWASRASMRLYQKQKQDNQDESKKRPTKPKCVRVSRTVELVDQSDEKWREEKAKLLFILSLGLSPKPEAPVIGPLIRLTHADPQLVAVIEKRYESERILRLERQRIEDESLQRDRYRQELNRAALKQMKRQMNQFPIEVIDLASDDEDKESADTGYILPDLYPDHPDVTIRPVIPRRETKTPFQTATNFCRKKAAPASFKRLDNRVNRVRHMPNSSQQFPTNGQSHTRQLPFSNPSQWFPKNGQIHNRRFPPVPPSKRVPEREKSHIYVAPSPPMMVTDRAPVSQILEQMQSNSNPYVLPKSKPKDRVVRMKSIIRGIAGKGEGEEVIQID